MSYYSIKDLETLSGIKAHTLRIWEQRYHIIQPKRTETNIRFYDDEDLKKILNISLLNQNGYKISKIADMSVVDMSEHILTLSQENHLYPDQIQTLVMCMIELDEERFEKIMWRCIQHFGMEDTMIHIVYPFLNKVGLLWQIGTINPYQEHFVSNLIRQKLITATDALMSVPATQAKKFLLFLPDGELHEIGLLFSSYVLKKRGFKVFYFGQSLPFQELKEACALCQPDYTFTVITSLGSEETKKLIEVTGHTFPNIHHFMTGYQVVGQNVAIKNVMLMASVQDFIDYVDKLTVPTSTVNKK